MVYIRYMEDKGSFKITQTTGKMKAFSVYLVLGFMALFAVTQAAENMAADLNERQQSRIEAINNML